MTTMMTNTMTQVRLSQKSNSMMLGTTMMIMQRCQSHQGRELGSKQGQRWQRRQQWAAADNNGNGGAGNNQKNVAAAVAAAAIAAAAEVAVVAAAIVAA